MALLTGRTLRLAVAVVLLAGLAEGCRPRDSGGSSALVEAGAGPEAGGGRGSFPIWDYDAGPNPSDAVGKELIDLNSSIPYFPGLSTAIYGDQMFRPAFGPIVWRMMQKPNSVKILFIGQDGTHIAEAAGRPATAGFGGRAQDLAKYFGVSSSAAFINTFAFTIRWQYGAFDTPILSGPEGHQQLSFGSFTGNPVWLLSQDLESPIVKWRNNLISWIIKNNKDSLKMIVLSGGSARDAAGSYVVSKGGVVGTRKTAAQIAAANLQIPEFELDGAGSNKQTAYILNKQGKDLYAEFKGAQPNYTDPAAVAKLHKDFAQAVQLNQAQWVPKMVLTKGGLNGSGMIHPAQLGGYDIDEKMQINGETTISLKGLKIDDSLTIDRDILITQLPHPTALSMMAPAAASRAVGESLQAFNKYVQNGWTIEADPGFTNSFATGSPYAYKRGDMGTEYYDFGAPNSRMVNISTASRAGANVIVFGTREKAGFDQLLIKKMTFAKPAVMPPSSEMWIARPISTAPDNRRYAFDSGPGEEFAKIMKSTLPIDAAFVKAREVNGDFGHYRGTFKDPKVVIIADPHGEDDLITARALTGSRGQYLQAVMDSIGVNENYLVIKTAPYSKDDKWAATVEATKDYREALLKRVFEVTHPEMIIVDGPSATAEFARIFPVSPAPLVTITRPSDDPKAGISEAIESIQRFLGFEAAAFNNVMGDIPRTHLTYYARVWEGTSGDRVITSNQPQFAGIAFAEVAPRWAFNQIYKMTPSDIEGCKVLAATLNAGKLRMGLEKVTKYTSRLATNTPGQANCDQVVASTNDAAAATVGSPVAPMVGGPDATTDGDPSAGVADRVDADLTHSPFDEAVPAYAF